MSRKQMSELGSTNQRSCRLWLRFGAVAAFDVHMADQHSPCPVLGKATWKKSDMLVQALPPGRLYVHIRGRQGNGKAVTHTAPGSKLP